MEQNKQSFEQMFQLKSWQYLQKKQKYILKTTQKNCTHTHIIEALHGITFKGIFRKNKTNTQFFIFVQTYDHLVAWQQLAGQVYYG